MEQKLEIFRNIFNNYEYNSDILSTSARAKINFAIIKYWGKENKDLMIPSASSISFTLEDFFGTEVFLEKNFKNEKDIFYINDNIIKENSYEYIKLYNFINIFKNLNKELFSIKEEFFIIKSFSNIPIASGLASSASFFASLTKAFFNFYEKKNICNSQDQLNNNLINLHKSIIARFGSISASRSVYDKDVIKLYKDDKMTYSASLKTNIMKKLFCGIVLLDKNEKKIKSSQAMDISKKNIFFQKWLQQTEQDLKLIEKSITEENVETFFDIILSNSESLSTLLKKDNIIYDNEKTIKFKNLIKSERKNNSLITFTQDAGANLKVISDDKNLLKELFKHEELIISKIA